MHTGKLKGKLLAGLASCLMSMGTLGAYAQEAGWTVYTDTYRPYTDPLRLVSIHYTILVLLRASGA